MKIRWVWPVVVVGLAIAGMGALSWLVFAVPDWVIGKDTDRMSATDRAAALGNVRGQLITLVSVLSGVVVAAYGVYRYFLDKDKQRLDEDKHLTGLFDSAAGRLASEESTVRAVAIRTLYRLMVDSPRDHLLVLNTICDALRRYAVPPPQEHDSPPGQLSPEVAAAVDALRDRPQRDEPRPLDLTGVWLRGANLRGVVLHGAILGREQYGSADMAGADLTEADLTNVVWPQARSAGATLNGAILAGASLSGADLTGAILSDVKASGARLSDAILFRADLTRADLRNADLRRARLRGAKLRFADLTGAELAGTDLTGTDLREAQGLTDAMMRAAVVDSDTALPPGLSHPRLRPTDA